MKAAAATEPPLERRRAHPEGCTEPQPVVAHLEGTDSRCLR
jgi:hypothetical protein